MRLDCDAPEADPYDSAAARDPLGIDPIARRLSALIAAGELGTIKACLADAAAAATAIGQRDREAAMAALRDLDFLVNAAHRLDPASYKSIGGLEAQLVRLGRIVDHVPRGSVFTYGLCNPLDDRMRTFTGTGEERLFIFGLHDAMIGLDGVLVALTELARHRLDCEGARRAADELLVSWEPMVAAVVDMRRHMPPELFSQGIIPFFGSLDIAGVVYDGITGAHMQTVAVDHVLHGADASDPTYRAYVEHNLAALRPHQRALVATTLACLGQRPLLVKVTEEVERYAAGASLDAAAAAATLRSLHRFLARVSTFRVVHTRLAEDNLPLRPTATGSGGHDMELLADLLERTQEARRDVRDAETGVTLPRQRCHGDERPSRHGSCRSGPAWESHVCAPIGASRTPCVS
jgi:hypothetical protein